MAGYKENGECIMTKLLLRNLGNCFKDQMLPTITYVVGVLLVVSFYALSSKEEIEYLYPLTLALVVYVIYFLIAFLRFLSFQKALQALSEHQDVEVKTSSYTEKQVKQRMFQVHSTYSQKIHDMEMRNKEEVRFLSTWVHNMKTPVSVTNLILQRFNLGKMSKEELLTGLMEENEKLNGQLDMVLNLLRMNEFVKDYLPEQVNLTKSLNEVINQNQKLFIYNRIYPKVEKPEADVYVLSDAKWNNLVLQQIIANGVKYARSENPEETKNMDFSMVRKKDKVVLTIRDYGKGIPEYDLPRVFEPFFTGENGRTTKGASGIGLYFCKEVCKMLGHELAIASEVGKGTTVTITYLAKL